MGIKSDRWIRKAALEQGMITPFEPGQVRTKGDERIVSYGTSSYGYDVRCSNEFKIFTNINSSIVDPIIVNVTPLEPEWEGHVTLEFSNTTPLPARIYANEGVAQMLFLGAEEVCETSYKDRNGKYMGQTGVVVPRT